MIRRLAPLAVYSNIFLVMLGLGVIGPNLTDIRKDLDASYAAISWGVSAFALARLITNLPIGIAAGKLPRLPLLMAGTLCVAAGSVVAALSGNLALFLVARAVSGVGSSVATTVGLTIVLEGADPARRGRASGSFHSALGGGALFGPGFGALLASFGGWRAALLGSAGAAAVSVLLLAIVLREARSIPALGGGQQPAAPGGASRHSSMVGLVVGASFVAYVAAFAVFFVRGGVQQTVIPLMGRDELGLSVTALSVLLMGSAALGSLLGPTVGALSDRVGRARVLLPGLALLALGTVILTAATAIPLFVTGVLVTSIAGTTFSIPSSMIVDHVEPSQRSAAIGLYRVVGDAALTVAPFASGALIDRSGFMAAGLFSAGIVCGALILGWTRSVRDPGSARRPQPTEEVHPAG